MTFRCAAASASRGESLAGTASTVRAFLLLQVEGSWGIDAVRDARLPDDVRAWLVAARRRGIRPLLIRGRGDDGTRAFLVSEGTVRTIRQDDVRDLAGLALDDQRWTSYDGDLFLVCTHGRHDACCAERGRPLWAAMAEVAPDETWQVSHIGGDRFAGNLLVLPAGLYYGRLTPDDAANLVSAHRRGELDLEHLRGRCSSPFVAQAAEIALRRQLGLPGDDAVTLHGVRGDLVSFDVGGQTWEVAIATEEAPARLLTCRAAVESPAPSYVVREIRQSSN